MSVDTDIPRTGTRLETEGALTASSQTATVASNAAANTKGVYTEMVASSGFDAKGFILIGRTNTANNRDWLLDIAFGAAASEVDKVSNLLYCAAGSDNPPLVVYLPIPIPAGTRISMRGQSSTGAQNIQTEIILIANNLSIPLSVQRIETNGANTADSGAQQLDPGATANTKGAYAQLTASSGFVYRYVVVIIGNQAQSTRTAITWLVDIATGAAASEQVIISNIACRCPLANVNLYSCFVIPVEIPAGSRIAARCQASANTATNRLIDCEVIGIG